MKTGEHTICAEEEKRQEFTGSSPEDYLVRHLVETRDGSIDIFEELQELEKDLEGLLCPHPENYNDGVSAGDTSNAPAMVHSSAVMNRQMQKNLKMLRSLRSRLRIICRIEGN